MASLSRHGAIYGAHRLGMVRLEEVVNFWHFCLATKKWVAREDSTFGSENAAS